MDLLTRLTLGFKLSLVPLVEQKSVSIRMKRKNVTGRKIALDDRKPAAIALDDRKPAAIALDDRKPAAIVLDDRKPAAIALDDRKPAAIALDDQSKKSCVEANAMAFLSCHTLLEEVLTYSFNNNSIAEGTPSLCCFNFLKKRKSMNEGIPLASLFPHFS